jgi:hypothetical protein
MAIAFNQHKGEAQKTTITGFQYRDGANQFRLVGDILARYVYWIKGENGKDIPLECLSFDRDKEAFTNVEKDWVREYYPDLKCGWSYATQCIDNGEVKVLNLKKKLWQQIVDASKKLGDPTDPDEGWDVVFERKKTGPLPYNVEYNLQHFECAKRPLSVEERGLYAGVRSMDDVMPRPAPDAQKQLLDRVRGATTAEVDKEAQLEAQYS